MTDNVLYYGDNLDVMRRYIADESIDLVYLDPPFNSNATYNVLFAEKSGQDAPAQIKAFEDTWHWDQGAEASYWDVLEQGGTAAIALKAMRDLLGQNDMMAYLSMMTPRLLELRRIIKSTGSVYLHCDQTASHYLKVVMDAVFDKRNFQNEIVWSYRSGGASPNRFSKKHDVLLTYSKSGHRYFEALHERSYNRENKPYRFKGVTEYEDEAGHWYTMPFMRDVWEIPMVGRTSAERLGYPTQKPIALLERVIESSCPDDGVVLDPFCGCGTTIDAAQKFGVNWIGIDITHLAVGLIKTRLADSYGLDIAGTYSVVGEPADLDGAQELAATDPFQFQAWSLGLVGARVAGSDKKGGDKGIDGRLFFQDDASGTAKQVVFSVKAGHLMPAFVDQLHGVLEKEHAALRVLISMNDPTRGMRATAAAAGKYDSGWGLSYPKIQLLTIAELLDGRTVDMPPIRQVSTTFKRAPSRQKDVVIQPSLLMVAEESEDYEPSDSG